MLASEGEDTYENMRSKFERSRMNTQQRHVTIKQIMKTVIRRDRKWCRWIGVVWVLMLVGIMHIQPSEADSVDGAVYTPQGEKTEMDTPTLKADYQQTTIPLNIVLPAVTEKEKILPSGKGQPLQVGVGRNIPDPYDKNLDEHLTWHPLKSGGQIAAFTVTSPDAAAIRLGIVANNMPEGVEIRFFSVSVPEQIFGPFSAKDIVKLPKEGDDKPENEPFLFWSPVIEGDTVGVEIYLPSSSSATDLSIAIPQVSHLIQSVLRSEEKRLSDIGRSGSCNIDVVCRTTNIVKDTVAKILFTTSSGGTALCTGTLLMDNDSQSWTAYFMTANHCLSTQTVANTINSYWFFERQTCGGAAPTTVTQRTGGGELLSTGTNTDYTLLQLDDTLPGGVAYAGFDSGTLAQNATVTGIHHPSGDLKKWSQGSNTGFADYLGNVNGTGSHIRIVWSQGTTEGGSSGSALFDSSNRFRGNLHGGYASCSSQSQPDWYGRFDLSYSSVKRWIWDGPTVMTSGAVYTGSVASGDSKEYKITTSASQIKVELYGLSADADLYVRRGDRPTLDVYNCRPYSGGTTAETCTLSNTGTNTYYIRVRGYSSSTSYSLKTTAPDTNAYLLWTKAQP